MREYGIPREELGFEALREVPPNNPINQEVGYGQSTKVSGVSTPAYVGSPSYQSRQQSGTSPTMNGSGFKSRE